MVGQLKFTPGHCPNQKSLGITTAATLTFQGLDSDQFARLSDVSLLVNPLSPEGYREPEGIIYRKGPTLRTYWETWITGETKVLFSPLFDTVGFEIEGTAQYQSRQVTIQGCFRLPMYNGIGLAEGAPFLNRDESLP